MGIYDIPAVLHYITKVSEREKVYYIGHSMGTTELFIALSLLPHLNQLVATAFLYAPVAFLSNTISISRHIAPFAEELYVSFDPFIRIITLDMIKIFPSF
jgi:lysosomal acid lipase/cholesteryl ester hydrolase